jgi:HSP20 family protein
VSKRRDLELAAEEIEQLFADLWQVFPFSGLRRGFRPPVDVYRRDDPASITVIVELAGIDPDTVRIVGRGRTIVVAGERVRPRVTGQAYQQMEIDYGSFERHVTLSDDVDYDAVQATYDGGLLTIVLPLAPKPVDEVRVSIAVVRQR